MQVWNANESPEVQDRTIDTFKVGTKVRRRLHKTKFQKKSDPTWSMEIYEIIDISGNRYQLSHEGKTFPHLVLFRDLQQVTESFKPRRRARGRHRANLPEGDQKLYELPEPEPESEPAKVTIPVIKAKPLRRSTRTRDRKVDYSKYY